jgi:hypothetical protein
VLVDAAAQVVESLLEFGTAVSVEEPAHGPQAVELPLAVVSGGLGIGEEVTNGSTCFGQQLQFGPWVGGLTGDRSAQAVLFGSKDRQGDVLVAVVLGGELLGSASADGGLKDLVGGRGELSGVAVEEAPVGVLEVEVVLGSAAAEGGVELLAVHGVADNDPAGVDGGALGLVDGHGVAVGQMAVVGVPEGDADRALTVVGA